MMSTVLLTRSNARAIPVILHTEKTYKQWIKAQSKQTQAWLKSLAFDAKPRSFKAVPGTKGDIAAIVAGVKEPLDIWSVAHLPAALPKQVYQLDVKHLSAAAKKADTLEQLSLGWALATYKYTTFRKDTTKWPSLVLDKKVDAAKVKIQQEATCLVRDLVNAPTNIMGPSELTAAAKKMADEYKATTKIIKGKNLLKENYPAIHAVGRACDDPPHLIDIRWGKATHPKVTLVGKGVCFDTGGLDIKPSQYMLLMKKDMGGAASVLGLAKMIMAQKLKVRLRVLIPAVENSINGDAFRPSDVLETRKGLTVEVGNTDAEGRLVLCDALAEADKEKPALIVDCATLTGAARVALGADVPAYFTDSDAIAKTLDKASMTTHDPMWRLPLYMPYDAQLASKVADVNNVSPSAYGGAITAALFLKRFVEHTKDWVHVDMMAWNTATKPGRPVGGEAMGMRALYQLITSYAA